VACGSLAGNRSDPVIITSQERNNADNTAYLATISSLVVALITSVVAFTTAIVIILQRSKAKIKELQLVPSNRATSSTQMESMAIYEDTSLSVSAINTKENVAYGHTKTSTSAI
jgi:peroxiredoxin family protein